MIFSVFLGRGTSEKVEKSSGNRSENQMFKELNLDDVTTEWNNSYLFSSREDALEKLGALKKSLEEINETYRPAIPVLAINVCKRRCNIFIFRNHFIYTDFFYSRSVGKVHDYPNFDSYFHR